MNVNQMMNFQKVVTKEKKWNKNCECFAREEQAHLPIVDNGIPVGGKLHWFRDRDPAIYLHRSLCVVWVYPALAERPFGLPGMVGQCLALACPHRGLLLKIHDSY